MSEPNVYRLGRRRKLPGAPLPALPRLVEYTDDLITEAEIWHHPYCTVDSGGQCSVHEAEKVAYINGLLRGRTESADELAAWRAAKERPTVTRL